MALIAQAVFLLQHSVGNEKKSQKNTNKSHKVSVKAKIKTEHVIKTSPV